jgi:hypothetical protein
MLYARQSTAKIVTVGPVLAADGTFVTDSVVGDFKISKNGGAPAALNGSATLTHRHTGNYSLSLTATDLDTVGSAEVTCDDTVNACPIKEIQVVEEAVYDAMFAAAAVGPLLASSNGSGLTEAGGTGDQLTAIPWNAAWGAEVQSEVADALAVYDGPTNAEMVARTLATADYATATALATLDDFVDTEVLAIKAVTDKLDTALVLDGAEYQFTANALELAPAGGGGLDAAGVRAAIGLAAANLDTQLADIPTNAELATALDPLPTAAEIRIELDANSVDLNAIIAGLVAVEAKIDIVDTVVDAVQAQTDQFVFTHVGLVDVATVRINNVIVTGTGVPVVDPWVGAP